MLRARHAEHKIDPERALWPINIIHKPSIIIVKDQNRQQPHSTHYDHTNVRLSVSRKAPPGSGTQLWTVNFSLVKQYYIELGRRK